MIKIEVISGIYWLQNHDRSTKLLNVFFLKSSILVDKMLYNFHFTFYVIIIEITIVIVV